MARYHARTTTILGGYSMKLMQRFTAALLLVLSVAATSAMADDAAVSLVRTAKEGDSTRLKTVLNAQVLGMDVIVTHKAKYTVKEVRKNGDLVIVQKDEGTVINVGGTDQPPQDAAPEITEVRDKLGKLVEMK